MGDKVIAIRGANVVVVGLGQGQLGLAETQRLDDPYIQVRHKTVVQNKAFMLRPEWTFRDFEADNSKKKPSFSNILENNQSNQYSPVESPKIRF